MKKKADPRLGQLRRRGNGVWYIEVEVRGNDEPEKIVVRGNVSQTMAQGIATYLAAQANCCDPSDIKILAVDWEDPI